MGQSDAGTNDATSRHSEIALTDKPFFEIREFWINVNLPAGSLSFWKDTFSAMFDV